MSFIEIHVLQNFSPSNLNRDDTGSPKDCEFGGYRRARISSQCQKRAVRRHFNASALLRPEELAIRTKRAAEEVARRLVTLGRPAEQAAAIAQAAVEALGIKPDRKRPTLTSYLIYLSKGELEGLADWANNNWDKLVNIVDQKHKGAEQSETATETDSKRNNKAKKKTTPVDPPDELKTRLQGKNAADVALFGRMLADFPDDSVEAAAQVAHAISTNRVNSEFDYYTAVDDLKPDDTAAADMVGTVEFNSACYYRYANVNVNALRANLDSDEGLAIRTIEAFIRGFVLSVPTGKQNSMAAHNPPSFILAVRRSSAPCNLANAFVKPVSATGGKNLIAASVDALDQYWGRLAKKFGQDGIEQTIAWSLDDQSLESITTVAENFDQFVRQICGTESGEKAA